MKSKIKHLTEICKGHVYGYELDDLLEFFDSIKTIDCGYGEIYYIEPNNIKLQCVMESFKQRLQMHAC